MADAAAALSLDASVLDVPGVLDLARDVAHGVARPAARGAGTAFLVGLAAGRAGGDPSALRASTKLVLALLREGGAWAASPEYDGGVHIAAPGRAAPAREPSVLRPGPLVGVEE